MRLSVQQPPIRAEQPEEVRTVAWCMIAVLLRGSLGHGAHRRVSWLLFLCNFFSYCISPLAGVHVQVKIRVGEALPSATSFGIAGPAQTTPEVCAASVVGPMLTALMDPDASCNSALRFPSCQLRSMLCSRGGADALPALARPGLPFCSAS